MRARVQPESAEFAAGDEAQRRLSSLLPSSVVCVARDPSRAPAAALHPEEEQYVRGAVAKRRLEFAAGRACARAALESFGVPDAVLPRRADRMPLWVEGFVGSITHCEGAVAAAVARSAQVASVGIDIETAAPLSAELRSMIASERERERIARLGSTLAVDGFKLVFSAKESFFKCHFPLAGVMLEFEDVDVVLDPEGGAFVGALTGGRMDAIRPRVLHGKFCVGSRHIFTAVVLARSAELRSRDSKSV